MPPGAAVAGPVEAAKGSVPRLLPLGPHQPHARSSAAGLLPGTRRVPGISADKPSKEALHRRPIGKPRKKPAALQGAAEALRKKQNPRRQIAASMPHASGRTCPKGPENVLRTDSCADASARSAMRHRKRRRKGGGDAREPQGDDVAQARRDHEAQEQGAARAARDDPDGGVRGVHGRARLPRRAARRRPTP